MLYLIAYDIADPRRLQRVGRFMAREAVRCQKSVFIFRGDDAGVERVLNEVVPLLNLDEDCVQAWRLSPSESPTGRTRGTAANIYPAAVILGEHQPYLLTE